MKEYHIITPKKLNLEGRLKQFPPDFEFNLEFAYFVISDILKQTAYKFQEKDNPNMKFEDIYIQQCADNLQSLNRDYRKHMRYLCENFPGAGNILWREDYSEVVCYSYKLAPNYEKGTLKTVILKDKCLIRKIKARSEFTVPNKLKKTYNFLIGYIDPNRLKIKTEDALKYVSDQYKRDRKYKNQLINFVKVLSLQNGEYFISYNPNTDGRVHTTITTFPKQLRRFLRFDGKRLAEIDISSSVPTFLYFLLSNLNTNNTHLNNVITSTKAYSIHYMSVKNSVGLDMKEIELFGKLVLSGAFYRGFIEDFHKAHYIMDKLEPDEYYKKNVKKICDREFDGDLKDLEKVVKKNMLSMFNAKPNKFFAEEVFFWKKFPTINYFIMSLKKKNHKYFSHLMLQIESYFMLHIVARQLNNTYRRKVPILTLHDCIITTEDNMEKVYDFTKNTLNYQLGFDAKMKCEIYV
ncbi:hypothetical protein SAMN05421824_0963 [Hyunsoonleella jejuensis]|uniref:Uncharacterized protein n=1 Tax=Hyunsoonleella jejuensis TaxID=419940 RepID=A0A1H9CQE0_9FLAO|nr:hypothetical protein [Hyunsoonleella jejuensis]SEQ02828.1 hypothetical protein SAMN05421824_0963 [Hyunsoonleella jejuensis]